MRLLLLFCLTLPGLLSAGTLIVNSTADTSDPGTLRWAIEQHNASGTANQVEFDSSLANQTIFLTSNLPQVIFNPLVIDGSDAPGLAIDANTQGRIFIIANNAVRFTLRNIDLQNSDGVFGGGCIRATGSGNLEITVERVRFSNCEQRPPSSGSFPAFGGAIYSELGSQGLLTIRNSYFINNRVYGSASEIYGGAIYAEGGRVEISRTTFELNTAENLGSALSAGGAIYIRDAITDIVENEFLFNQADGSAGGALVLNLSPSLSAEVTANLFAGNLARLGAAVWTGTQTLGSNYPFILFINNTFSQNTSESSPGGTLYFREGQLLLRTNTFVDNVNLAGAAAHMAFNTQGIEFFAVTNNLFGPATSPACASIGGASVDFATRGYNVLPDASCDIQGLNDFIGDAGPFLSLGNYGGATRTIPPVHGNRAIDAGEPAMPSPVMVARCPTTDARGVTRPGDGDADGNPRCDIGAFEWADEAPVFFDSFEQTGLVIP